MGSFYPGWIASLNLPYPVWIGTLTRTYIDGEWVFSYLIIIHHGWARHRGRFYSVWIGSLVGIFIMSMMDDEVTQISDGGSTPPVALIYPLWM
jgi:hypothetical protein